MSVKPRLEPLEDRTLLSAPASIELPAAEAAAAIESQVLSVVEQRVQLFTTIVQCASNALNTWGQGIIQELASLEPQWAALFGITPDTSSQSPNAAPPPSASGNGASQSPASGSGSGSGTMTTGHDGNTHSVGTVKPLDVSGSGTGTDSGSSFNATVTGQIWLDNDHDNSIDENEMDYSGARVTLLYQVSSGGGTTWSTLASTTTNSNLEGNNYSIGVAIPPGGSYTCEIDVAIPLDFGDEAEGSENDINAQGFSPVFTLIPGGEEVVGAALDSMNVNTLTDDPNGVLLQNTVTLRDAIKTGNNGPPFPAVTFDGTPSGTIYLQATLDNIEKSYDINGPGRTTLAVDGDNDTYIFDVNAGVISTIRGLKITEGSGGVTDAGGIINNGNLTLNNDWIYGNQTDGLGGGISNNLGAQLSLQQVLIDSNQAAKGGGGIYNTGTVSIYDGVTITQNRSASGGAGVFNGGGKMSAYSSVTIEWNTNTGGSGCGVMNRAAKFQIFDGGFIHDNKSAADGGGVSNSAGTMTLQGVALDNNSSLGKGGGIYTRSGSLTLTDVSIGSSAKNIGSEGGGMYVKGGTVKMSGGSIEFNSATYTSATKGGGLVKGGGGGLYVGGGSVTLTGVAISNNRSNSDGGGVFNDAGGSLTLNDNGNIASNWTANQGGGMYLANQSTTNFNGVTVANNRADAVWGGWPIGKGIYQQNNATVNPADPPPQPNLTDNDDPGGTPDKGP